MMKGILGAVQIMRDIFFILSPYYLMFLIFLYKYERKCLLPNPTLLAHMTFSFQKHSKKFKESKNVHLNPPPHLECHVLFEVFPYLNSPSLI